MWIKFGIAVLLVTSRLLAQADNARTDVARYLSSVCADGKEHAVFYIPEKRTIVDVTARSDFASVITDVPMAMRLMRTEHKLIEAHCHSIVPATYADLLKLNADKRRALEILGDVLVQQRLLMEMPSATDMNRAIELESLLLRPARQTIEHWLVVVVPGSSPRIIRYGCSRKNEVAIREGRRAYILTSHIPYLRVRFRKKLDAVETNVEMSYEVFVNARWDTWCLIDQLTQCEEPSYEKFAKRVNESGEFFLEDLGYVDFREKP